MGTVVATVEYDTYREPPTTGLWNVRMHVTGSVGATIFIPLIGNVLGLQNSQSLPLTSNEDFRVEGAPSQANPSLTGTGWSTTYTTSGACP